MTEHAPQIELSRQDLREVTAFAAGCAEEVLGVFEADRPDDPRPRRAVETAREFARGGERGKALRDAAWAALKAGQEADGAAREAARAAMAAAGAAYLHPLAKATQVKHILGSAAHAARAAELGTDDGDPAVGEEHVRRAARRAPPAVADVLLRYPPAPAGGGRTGELLRLLDTALRHERPAHG
ncbi:putative immunity protein [Streptomyces abyssomicinicus]|uniref:putative immunity protein n=1 Tax=Streptomyces abyssomicinicus TaxID=574929 RepID=UPI00125091DA|nr:exonuclease SbcC [Streptomyces abyssomicinicus]